MKYFTKVSQKLKDWRKCVHECSVIQRFPGSVGMLQLFFFYFLIFFMFRLRLFIERYEDIQELSLQQYFAIFWMGFRLDGVVIGYTSVLLVIFLLFLPNKWASVRKKTVLIYTSFFYLCFIFSEISGFYFFSYFDFRPNYLVLDHWKDFQLVETVYKAYPVPLAIGFGAFLFAGVFLQQKHFSPLYYRPRNVENIEIIKSGWWDRCALLFVFVLCGLLQRGTIDHRPLNPSASAVTNNRVANEIANSGMFKVAYEGLQRSSTKYIPVKSVITTIDSKKAFELVRKNFERKGRLTNDSSNPLVTLVDTERPLKDLNVVLIVMESMQSKLIGSLGGNPAASPEFDLLGEEGIFLQNCYATGERTIQGLEAVICSFPPLPGVGIVRRPQAQEGFTTLASVLKGRGYRTAFLYGGQGVFDHKIGFFLGNGYDTFLEEKDFKNPIYKSPWGASDEDLYLRADQLCTSLYGKGKPFLCTILTSSLHSPWVYPEGRIDPFPKDVYIPPGFDYEEVNNFKYADYALGKYFREIQDSNYFKDTIFVMVGDHGVHLRGKGLIPVDEYRVGALFYAPYILKPEKITRPASQLDIAPTILGLLGGSYRTTFFGNDLFKCDEEAEYSLMVYDKKRYGIISRSLLTILSKSVDNVSYTRDSVNKTWKEMPGSEEHGNMASFSASILQVAETLLQEKKYHTKVETDTKIESVSYNP